MTKSVIYVQGECDLLYFGLVSSGWSIDPCIHIQDQRKSSPTASKQKKSTLDGHANVNQDKDSQGQAGVHGFDQACVQKGLKKCVKHVQLWPVLLPELFQACRTVLPQMVPRYSMYHINKAKQTVATVNWQDFLLLCGIQASKSSRSSQMGSERVRQLQDYQPPLPPFRGSGIYVVIQDNSCQVSLAALSLEGLSLSGSC